MVQESKEMTIFASRKASKGKKCVPNFPYFALAIFPNQSNLLIFKELENLGLDWI